MIAAILGPVAVILLAIAMAAVASLIATRRELRATQTLLGATTSRLEAERLELRTSEAERDDLLTRLTRAGDELAQARKMAAGACPPIPSRGNRHVLANAATITGSAEPRPPIYGRVIERPQCYCPHPPIAHPAHRLEHYSTELGEPAITWTDAAGENFNNGPWRVATDAYREEDD